MQTQKPFKGISAKAINQTQTRADRTFPFQYLNLLFPFETASLLGPARAKVSLGKRAVREMTLRTSQEKKHLIIEP